jgi:hypothetical protein
LLPKQSLWLYGTRALIHVRDRARTSDRVILELASYVPQTTPPSAAATATSGIASVEPNVMAAAATANIPHDFMRATVARRCEILVQSNVPSSDSLPTWVTILNFLLRSGCRR